MTIAIQRVEDPAPCYAIRHTVFVEEQNVPVALEIDELDETAIHLLATSDAGPIGAARIVVNGDTGKIGRVCVMKDARGTGLGALLIKAALEELKKDPSVSRAVLGAQVTALGFYEKLGFAAYGDVFDDAGIDHQMMALQLSR